MRDATPATTHPRDAPLGPATRDGGEVPDPLPPAGRPPEHGSRPLPRPPRPLPVLARPWFWLLFIGALWAIPLVKGLGKDLPEPLPGADRPPVALTLPDETGREVSLADLAGHLLVVTELPMANAPLRDRVFDGIRLLRKRLKGLASTVVYVVLCHGGDAADVSALLDVRRARKPLNVFLVDPDRAGMAALRRQAGSESAEFVLLDRHNRVRGLYRSTPEDVDRLVMETGMLANWPGQDRPPGR